jgi:small-conductance mechanosensitive channel
MELLAIAKQRLEALSMDLGHAPEEARQAAEATHAMLMSGMGVRGATYLVILLFIGIAVEWLYWTYAYSPLRALQSTPAQTPLQALRVGLKLLLLRCSGLLLFTAAALGASAAFSWPPRVHELVVVATMLLLVLRLTWIAVSIVIAPGRPQRKLVPVAPGKARWLAAALLATVFLLACGSFLPPIVETGAGKAHHFASTLRLAAYTAAAALLFVAAFAFFGKPASGSGARSKNTTARTPLFPRSFPLALLVVAVYAVWLLNERAAAVTAIFAIVIALQIGLREMVYFYWRGDSAQAQAQAQDAERAALPAIVLSLARFIVALAGIGAAALALDTPLSSLAENASPLVRIGLRLLGVAVLALLAHGVWIAIRSVVDQRLSSIGPINPHEPPDASSRLLTLLPLLRVTAAVTLLVILVLTSLWAIGIEITPLLAGAGVLGIALGFGAQALVRDVIAGVFFLAEDAFRVGEYIEGAGNTKGNVERITLRSVALRHHNGPLHFVPYGALGSVRNTSRDWVIDKFNLPLPIEVESETIRKMIKKIGEEMKADPDIGPLMLEPLKGKLYRIDPGVKIFRCKFRSPPSKQFDVRASALKRIEAALKKAGIQFADGRQIAVMHAAPA